VDDAARDFVAALDDDRRPLFDRVYRLVLEAYPDAEVTLSYKMPTFVVGRFSLHVGVWKHGLSFYGWEEGRDAGFCARHPELVGDKGTLKLPPDVAAAISDDELRDFLRASLTE